MRITVAILLLLAVSCEGPHEDHAARNCRIVDLFIYDGYGTDDYKAILSCGQVKYLGNNAEGRPADPFRGYKIGDAWRGAAGTYEPGAQ